MKLLYIFSILFFAGLNSTAQTITLSNPSVFPRKGEVVELLWATLKSKIPALDTANFKLIHAVTKKKSRSSLNERRIKDPEPLLQADFTALGTVKITVVTGKRSAYPVKTYGRYVPERKDDFAWENDKIAFRMYGKELEKTPKEMAYGTDVWVKSTDRMVINERYKRGKYHENQGMAWIIIM